MKQIPSHENSVGAVGQCGKFSGCPRARAPLSVIFPIQWNNNYYSESSGWVKRSYVRIAMAFVSALCLSSTEGKSDAPTHLLFGSSFLFYFICYYASVSYFLFWSNWIDFSYFILIKLMSESKRIFDEESRRNVFDVQCKMFSTRQCFSLTYHESYFTCAWAGNACLLFSIFPIITVFTRVHRSTLRAINAAFAYFTRSFSGSLSGLVFYLSRSL